MKLVEGRSLEAVLERQGALPIETVIHILRQVGSGLAYAYQRMVVYRDVKSANILVERDGRVMISDFGVAPALDRRDLDGGRHRHRHAGVHEPGAMRRVAR